MATNDKSDKPATAEKVKKWLSEEGFPFEMEVATTLLEKGFTAEQGVYYVDEDTKKSREIDVVARISRSVPSAKSSISVTCVVECKYSKPKPWILLTARIAPRSSLSASRAITNDNGNILLSNVTAADESAVEVLSGPAISAYSALTAFRGRKDNGIDEAYAAPLSVARAARELARKDQESFSFSKLAGHTSCGIWIPIVVVDGLLFSAKLARKGLSIQPLRWARLTLKNPEAGGPETAVDVVTDAGLRAYIESVRATLNALATKLELRPEAATELILLKELLGKGRTTQESAARDDVTVEGRIRRKPD